jgi:enoyl-CoA hydratase
VTEEAPRLLVERRGAVLVLTLNRPEVRNAIDKPLADAIAAALDELDADDTLSVGVLAGAGKGFCAGMDLKAFGETGERPWSGDRGFAGIVRRSSDKPLIAAVEGFAVAGGLEIALACDLIVAAEGAKLGIPEVKRGLVAAGGALRRLPRLLPSALAMELALTGELITADRAYALGAINRLAKPGAALDDALDLAQAIAANGPLALRATKTILRDQWSWDDAAFWERQEAQVGPVMASEDAREGARAFTEKRAPQWRGR